MMFARLTYRKIQAVTAPNRLRALRRTVAEVFLLMILVSAAGAAENVWEAYSAEVYNLEPRESFQLRVTYDQIQVRSWKLVVDGGRERCDLSVLRVRGESLLYYRNDESRHEVLIPWGHGEEVIIVISNRDRDASFTVSLLGPPRDQVHAAYGYHVNRALEAFAAGQRLQAEDECRLALLEDPADGVAKVLLAGFLRDRNVLDRAAGLVDEALAGELSDDMRALAENLRGELKRLRAPLPLPVRQGVAEAEKALADRRPEAALAACDALLDGDMDLAAQSRSRLLMLRGQALGDLDRNFEAVDAFTQALAFNRNRETGAIIYYHMGDLFLRMENYGQALGSFTMALETGLPSGLELKARESLQDVQDRQAAER